MKLHGTRLKVRRMMATVAVMAVLLAVWVSFRRRLAPTPEEWALNQAAGIEGRVEEWQRFAANARSDLAAGYLKLAEEAPREAARYRALAGRYAKEKATWDEATWHGPFTCRLAPRQPAIVRWAITADSAKPGASVSLKTGTLCVVARDPALDDDAGECFREIEVRVLDGVHAGATVCVERESLRCR